MATLIIPIITAPGLVNTTPEPTTLAVPLQDGTSAVAPVADVYVAPPRQEISRLAGEATGWIKKKRNLPQAIRNLKKVLSLERVPRKRAILLGQLGGALRHNNNLVESERALRASLSLHKTYHAYYELGETLWRQGRRDESLIALRKALEMLPTFFLAAWALGEHLREMGELDAAKSVLEKARLLAHHPNEKLAFSLEKTLRAIERRDGSVDTIGRLKDDAHKAIRAEKWEEALLPLKELLANEERRGKITRITLLHLGNVLRHLNRLEEAEARLRQALQIEPHPSTHRELGQILYEMKRFEEALEQFQLSKHLDIASPNFLTFSHTAKTLVAMGRFQEAIINLKEAIRLAKNPRANLYYYLLVLLKDQKDYEAMRRVAEEGLAKNPQSEELHFYLGQALIELKHFLEAEKIIQSAISQHPNNSRYYYQLGFVLYKLKRFESALDAFQKAVDRNPNNFQNQFDLGITLMRLAKIRQDKDLLRRALEALTISNQLEPGEVRTLCELGIAQRKLDQDAESLASLNEAIRILPDFSRYHYQLGVTLFKMERLAEAKEAVLKSRKLNRQQSNKTYLESAIVLARIQRRTHDTEDARMTLVLMIENLQTENQDALIVYLELYDLLRAIGKHSEAAELVSQAASRGITVDPELPLFDPFK